MRQTHLAGEKLFVDWAGDRIAVFDAATGVEHRASIFVAALGASNYTYAEARWTETLPDWIGAHVNALAAIGGECLCLIISRPALRSRRVSNPASTARIRTSPTTMAAWFCQRA